MTMTLRPVLLCQCPPFHPLCQCRPLRPRQPHMKWKMRFVHMLHLVPSWQSEERHRKLKIMVGLQCYFFLFSLVCTGRVLLVSRVDRTSRVFLHWLYVLLWICCVPVLW